VSSALDIFSTIGGKLREARLRANLTQEELAEALGCSLRSLQSWEASDALPRAKHRRRIAAFMSEHEEEAA
jgi:transcriptional regulator with XRE-family HTH domain